MHRPVRTTAVAVQRQLKREPGGLPECTPHKLHVRMCIPETSSHCKDVFGVAITIIMQEVDHMIADI